MSFVSILSPGCSQPFHFAEAFLILLSGVSLGIWSTSPHANDSNLLCCPKDPFDLQVSQGISSHE